MAVVLDLLGSLIIAGSVILLSLRLSDTVNSTTMSSAASSNIMEQMVSTVDLMESDFKKIGYGVADPATALVLADSTRIRFRADLDRDGDVDSVEWYLGRRLTQYQDRDVRILCRRVNLRTDTLAASGVTAFKMRYLDRDGTPTTLLANIAMVELTVSLSSLYKVADQVNPDSLVYVTALVRQGLVAARNLSRHG
jgi:hypothetical protein